MAPLAASGKSISNTRKKLVQPALPALPKKVTLKAARPADSVPSATSVDSDNATPPATEEPSHRSIRQDKEKIPSEPPDAVDDAVEPAAATTQGPKAAEATEEVQELTSGPEQQQSTQPPPTPSAVVLAGPEDPTAVEPGSTDTDVLASTEPTQENIQHIQSELYEGNKVQEWAEDVNDGSNHSTYSVTKDGNTNGLASTDELPQSASAVFNTGRDAISKSSAHEMGGVNGYNQSRSSVKEAIVQDELSSRQLALPSMTEHLLHMATSKFWADWVIVVNVSGLPPLATYAHSLILVRSPRMEALMTQARTSTYGNAVINIYPPREILPAALEAALRFLYTDSVVAEDYNFPMDAGPASRPARASALSYILSYWIASIELGLPPVAARALQHLETFLNWDIAELVLKEADDLLIAITQATEGRINSADYVRAARSLRQLVVQFVARQAADGDYKLDTASSPSVMRSRFVSIEDARLRHNPALTTMVFGSMPSSADLSPSSPQSETLPIVSSMEDQVASNVVLNIDFSDLSHFSNELHRIMGADAVPILQAIVNERENRRSRVVSNRTVPNKMRIANSALWDVAGFKEYLHEGSLRRERVGFLIPVQSK